MSRRGKQLFDRYVKDHLNDPILGAMPMGTYAFNLTSMASDASIPIAEVIDEVGPLIPALSSARRARRR